MELHSSLVGIVGVNVDLVDSLSVEVGGPSDQAVYLVCNTPNFDFMIITVPCQF